MKVFNWLKSSSKKNKKVIQEGSVPIQSQEKTLFEKALKLYIFVHHIPHNQLDGKLAEQLKFTGNAVYSLILNWMKDGKPSLEYMDFLNEKLKELQQIAPTQLNSLEIKPDEIEEITLFETVKLSFKDDENNQTLTIRYEAKELRCYFEIVG